MKLVRVLQSIASPTWEYQRGDEVEIDGPGPFLLSRRVPPMKLVRVLQSIASPTWEYQRGDEVEIDDHAARAWAKAGIVEIIKERSAPGTPALSYPSIHGTEYAAAVRPALVTRG